MAVVGLHHREAEKIARREMPSLQAADAILANYSHDQIQDIARRGFSGEDLTSEEIDAMLAYTRVRFD